MDAAILPLAFLLTLAVALVSAAGLRAWHQWLEIKRLEIARTATRPRSEIGDLRRRVRRLEALANGIDL